MSKEFNKDLNHLIKLAQQETLQEVLEWAKNQKRSIEEEEAKMHEHSVELRNEICGHNTFMLHLISHLQSKLSKLKEE